MTNNNPSHNGDNNGRNKQAPVITYFWQVLGTVSSSALVGMFFWLWNVTIDIRDLQNSQQDVARIGADVHQARALIDRNSDRLTKMELSLDQNSNTITDVVRRFDELRSENRETIKDLLTKIDRVSAAIGTNVESTIRMTETLRQIERSLQAHTLDERPNYRPEVSPSYRPLPPPDERTP